MFGLSLTRNLKDANDVIELATDDLAKSAKSLLMTKNALGKMMNESMGFRNEVKMLRRAFLQLPSLPPGMWKTEIGTFGKMYEQWIKDGKKDNHVALLGESVVALNKSYDDTVRNALTAVGAKPVYIKMIS